MGARIIPDGSGGMVRWRITKAGQRPHVLNVHLAPWTPVTGAYVGTYTNGDTDVYDSASVMFAQLKLFYDTSTTLTVVGFFPTVSGVVSPLSNVDPSLSPETISGAGTNGSANELAAEKVITYHDDGGNTSRITMLDMSSGIWNPDQKRVLGGATSVGDSEQAIANILTGWVSAGVFHTTPYMSHAGGVCQFPVSITNSLNHRLRRDYGLD
jgi:hypothetical protein